MDSKIVRIYLTKRDLFEDNEYLEKYCDLIDDNIFNEHIKFKTMVHHIIPKHVFKCAGLDYDDSRMNKINLEHKKHVLAHYYLMMCAKDETCRRDNALAIQCLTNQSIDKFDINKLDTYQQLYESKIRKAFSK